MTFLRTSIALGLFIILLSSCTNTKSSIYSKTDLVPYIRKPVAFFVVSPGDSLPPKLWSTLVSKVEQRLKEFPSFEKVLAQEALNKIAVKNPHLKQLQHRYSTTLALTGISDKDLAFQLKEQLKVEQFLIMQLEEYPCTEESDSCETSQQLLIRLQLIDASTGEQIWRGRINQLLSIADLEPPNFAARTLQLTEELLQMIEQGFNIPWHRSRYENLKKMKASS
ncbi:hypothetical protein WDW89_12720 [Deltaproteobacteria bacterium TL4]